MKIAAAGHLDPFQRVGPAQCPLWVIPSVRGLQNQASGGKERIGHLELVAPLVVVQLPPAPRHDHEHLLLGEGRQGPIEEDLELGGDGMAALEDGSRHLVHRRRARRPHLLSRRVLAQAEVSESCNGEG